MVTKGPNIWEFVEFCLGLAQPLQGPAHQSFAELHFMAEEAGLASYVQL